MRDVYLIGAGMSKIGKREETSRELVIEAAKELMNYVDLKSVDAVYVGVQSETYEHQIMYGTMVAEILGLTPKEAYRVEACAAAGALAFRNAVLAVKSGEAEVALAVGVEKMSAVGTENVTDALMAASDFIDQYSGITIPAHYALVARRYMYQYGATEEDFCLVAVKNHKHALDNPKAHFQRAITVEECLRSKPVATPIKLLDSAPISDGVAVAVVASREAAKGHDKIRILASAVATDTLSVSQREDLTWPTAIWEAAQKAYRQAKIEPSQIKLAEVHDAFTINEVLIYEALGFAKRGEGYKLIREGQTYIGGKVAVNTSGGLKARGHPIGATGLAQIYEIFLQLTNRAGKRNVNADIAIAVNEGGVNSTAVVHIFSL